VVIPSRSEGLPRVALEAGACGAVCVATRVGGIPEVIEDGVTGLLAEPESPEALADALAHALGLSPDRRQRISAAATSRIRRHFGHEQTVAAYEALFHSLLEARTGSAYGRPGAGPTSGEPDRY
jgi:glycosyltransferase involved in cell wall biosynthesis